MNKEHLIVVLIGAVVVFAVLGGYLQSSLISQQNRACTMEAMVCPDGSTVGRTGPNCEFAACPDVTATSSDSVTLQAKMGDTVSGLGVSIIPTKILEDSRCPTDVQCIQAGTVRLQAQLAAGMGTSTQEFKLNQPITTEAETVTLIGVSPAKKSTVQIKNTDYTFEFQITKRAPMGGGILPYNSGVRGAVVVGPTCPVERIPPDPACAPRPYATTITARHTGTTSVFATTQSDATGTFEISLPPGAYTLSASGGQVYPRCADQAVTVQPTGYVTITLMCDSGIR